MLSPRPKAMLWEWLVILASLVDDALIALAILLLLLLLDIPVTLPVVIGLVVMAVVLTIVTRAAVIPALRRRIVSGAEGMVGLEGEAIERLSPRGMVKVRGEYWHARSTEGEIEPGARIQVTGISGLTLEVKRKL